MISLDSNQVEYFIKDTLSRYTRGAFSHHLTKKNPLRESNTFLMVLPDTESHYPPYIDKLKLIEAKADIACFLRKLPCNFQNHTGRIFMCSDDFVSTDRMEILGLLPDYTSLKVIEPSRCQISDIIDWNDKNHLVRLVYMGLANEIPVEIVYTTRHRFQSRKLIQSWQGILDDLSDLGIQIRYLDQTKPADSVAPELAVEKLPSNIPRPLILETDVEQIYKSGARILDCPVQCIITPLAIDRANALGLTINNSTSR